MGWSMELEEIKKEELPLLSLKLEGVESGEEDRQVPTSIVSCKLF
jgi:hypothetical protein